MKVLIVIPNLSGGGAERVASFVSKWLSRRHQVFIAVCETKAGYSFSGELIDLGIGNFSQNDLLNRASCAVRYIRKLKLLKSRLSPDVSLSFKDISNIPNVLSGSKTIVSVREFKKASTDRSAQKYITELLMRLLYNKPNKVVVNSRAIGISMEKDYGVKAGKIKVIYNPVDCDCIWKESSENLEGEFADIFTYPVILTAGRLVAQKGHWHLIRAFKAAKKSVPELKMVMLGAGNLRDYLKDLSAQAGLERDIYFLGFQNNPFKFISKSSIFAFPSLWEGFPNALLEAMACGVPVLSSDCRSGPREILAPDSDFLYQTPGPEYARYGVLMPVFDGNFKNASEPLSREEKIWADVIIEQMKNPSLRQEYGVKAKKRAGDFDTDKIMPEWEELLLDE